MAAKPKDPAKQLHNLAVSIALYARRLQALTEPTDENDQGDSYKAHVRQQAAAIGDALIDTFRYCLRHDLKRAINAAVNQEVQNNANRKCQANKQRYSATQI